MFKSLIGSRSGRVDLHKLKQFSGSAERIRVQIVGNEHLPVRKRERKGERGRDSRSREAFSSCSENIFCRNLLRSRRMSLSAILGIYDFDLA